MLLQLAFVLIAIIIGARIGGIGLGVLGGLGLGILTFGFGLQPTSPPIDVMLMRLVVCKPLADLILWLSGRKNCFARILNESRY